jgi:N-acetylmuramoyl-L-alanine amidase
MKIFLDVGHGGSYDRGAVGSYNGYQIIERDLNLIQADILREMLLGYENVEVLQSRLTNDGSAEYDAIGIDASAYRCNLWSGPEYGKPVDLMISVHNNAFNGNSKGHVLLTSLRKSNELAFIISDKYEAAGQPCRGIFYVTYENQWHNAVRNKPAPSKSADFHGIIRQTVNETTDSIIIESVFADSSHSFGFSISTIDVEEAIMQYLVSNFIRGSDIIPSICLTAAPLDISAISIKKS